MDVSNVDVLRLQLEATLTKLRIALKHWQTWEAEYEGLKEELQQLPSGHSADDLVKLGQGYEGALSQKEVHDLLGTGNVSGPRDVPQILGLLERRNDYVQRNIETLKKQIETGQEKLEKVAEVSIESRNEEGLPITDIYEELDEEGNVVSGRTSRPADAQQDVLKALKKLGLKDEDLQGEVPLAGDKVKDGPLVAATGEKSPEVHLPNQVRSDPIVRFPSTPPASTPELLAKDTGPIKRVVRFTDESAVLDTNAVSAKDKSTIPFVSTDHASSKSVSELARGSFKPEERVIELDSNDEVIAVTEPTPPINESREDARLRAQMLEYNMREVGEIVAQIDLEEGAGSGTDYDDDVDYDFDDDGEEADDGFSEASDAEDDDQYGLSRGGVITEDYVKEMLELEKRLKAGMFKNVGPSPQPNGDTNGASIEAPDRMPVVPESDTAVVPSATTPRVKASKNKIVRFAPNLDIAPHPVPSPSSNGPEAEPSNGLSFASEPVKENIIEHRSTHTTSVPPASTVPAKRPSRFKSSRQSAALYEVSSTSPSPAAAPALRSPLADTIVERGPSSTAAAAARAPRLPSEFDAQIQQRQLEDEFFRQRNRLVQREGGFSRSKGEEEMEEVSADEDEGEEGKRKKVSLFRAARVKGWDA